jgi:polyadenylation factor subunit 2
LQIKLWDARSAQHVTTYHGHRDRVSDVSFNANGNWLLSASRDSSCKLFELRMNRELKTFRGHSKEVTRIAWHPQQESYFVSGEFHHLVVDLVHA